MKYFAYGSNMSINRLRERVPSAVPIGVFSLPGHQLLFNKIGRDGTAKCHIHCSRLSSDMVIGRLYEIDSREKIFLDQAEGLGNGYEEKMVNVFNNSQSHTASTYYGTMLDNSLKPFTWYKTHVLIGAREANLPESYIRLIEAVPAIEDNDSKRQAQQLAIHG